MEDTLSRGHLLILQSQAPEDINVGEIIVYNADWHTQAPVVHRVIQRDYVDEEYRYYTQGDNNNQPDPSYRTYNEIVGVVIAAIPWIGNVTLFLQTPGVLPVVLVLLLILILVPEFLPKKDDEDKEIEGKLDTESDALNA
jgi:signal peptidase